MARPAPAVDRCVAVLNHLALQPTAQLTLSELARELGLNKATAHALLNTLVGAGYLVRDQRDKTYALGPALIAVGNAALAGNPFVRHAQPRMAALTAELELECVASAAIADEIVILARAGRGRPLGIDVGPGQRLPLAPPLGTVFVAWEPPEVIDRWLARVGPDETAADRALQRYRDALQVVRARGYSVALGGERQERLVRSLRDVPREGDGAPAGGRTGPDGGGRGSGEVGEHLGQTDEYALIELAGAATYRINHIGAPAFGADGRVAIALFLIGFHGEIPAEEVPRYAEHLLAVAAEVTAAARGRPPMPPPAPGGG